MTLSGCWSLLMGVAGGLGVRVVVGDLVIVVRVPGFLTPPEPCRAQG